VAFGEGLAHFALKDIEKARTAFGEAALAKDKALVADALYSLATCDHVEALQEGQEPKSAIGKLESAMQQYHEVLSRTARPEAARDANTKAATMWRQLKQQMEQQKQQQQPQSDGEKNEEEQDQQQNQDSQEEKKDEQQKNEQEQSSEKQQPQDSDQNKQQQAEQNESQEQEQQEAKQQSAEEKEQVSREQAERRLREMMQALNQRKKEKPQQVQRVVPVPVDKDW